MAAKLSILRLPVDLASRPTWSECTSAPPRLAQAAASIGM
jgi:hypothetical protein